MPPASCFSFRLWGEAYRPAKPAALPDVDAIGRPFGHGDIAALGGHRAVTHSVFFALAVAAVIALVTTRHEFESSRWRIGAYAAAVVLSHGLLDAFTTYGAGVAFLAPVSPQRWKSPWHPFTDLTSEVVLIWLPAVLMYLLWLRARIAARAPRAMQPNVR